jgi:hypothetical protein
MIYTDTGIILEGCPAPGCPGGSKSYSLATSPLGASQVILRLWCAATTCPNDNGLRGLIHAQSVWVDVQDSSAPSVKVTGGNLLTGWRRATATLNITSSDNIGIKLDRVLVDGTTREQRARYCRWGARIPCANGPAALTLDTTRLSDGPHTLSVQSVDAANNVGGQARTILLDKHPAGGAARPRAGWWVGVAGAELVCAYVG